MENKLYLAALHKIGINHKKFHLIFTENKNNDYKSFFEKLDFKILQKYNFTEKQIEYILKNKQELKIKEIEKKLSNLDVNIITFFEKSYPKNLKHISNPPFLIYVRGEIDTRPKLAIVGTRKITNYGEKIIENFIPELSKYFTIVSGGAAGCDTKAHLETLKNNGNTISVIGTGIDQNYPISNTKLYNNIVENGGAVVSIFPIGEIGNPYNFPIRNEIVVGLSLGVLVVEAALKSGSLITAQLALDLGKDLFAVPGEIFKNNSKGTNLLLANQEAKITLSVKDILEEYNIDITNNKNIIKEIPNFSNKIQEKIYSELINGNKNIEKLSKKINIETNDLLANISLLEITGVIKKNNNGDYEIN